MEGERETSALVPRKEKRGMGIGLSCLRICGNNLNSKEVDTDNTLRTSHTTARRYSEHAKQLEKKLTTSRRAEYALTGKGMSNSSYMVSDQVTDGSHKQLSLNWLNCYPIVSNDTESELAPLLFPYGKVERGMMRSHPTYRLAQIVECCRKHGIQLEQALSLRRCHIYLLNPNTHSINLGLGSEKEIYGTAKCLKSAVSTYLKRSNVTYAMKEESFEEGMRGKNMVHTPDFFLTHPVNLAIDQPSNGFSSFTEQAKINWIEVKMCCGVSIAPSDSTMPYSLGNILPTARQLVKMYGPGAFVFAYGCGASLRCPLRDIGVLVLDSNPLDLTEMHCHQKTWCADKEGAILP